MFNATHNSLSGKLILHKNDQVTNDSTETSVDNDNHYKLNVPSDFIINQTSSVDNFICLVTPYLYSSYCIYPCIHTKFSNSTTTYVRIRQTTKDYTPDFLGSDTNFRGDVDIVFISNFSPNLFERFKINNSFDPILKTGIITLPDSSERTYLSNINKSKYNIFLTPYLDNTSDSLVNLTNDNLAFKIYPNEKVTDTGYSIIGYGKDGRNNEDGAINMNGKKCFYLAIRKDIGAYYTKNNKPIIITGSSKDTGDSRVYYTYSLPVAKVNFNTFVLDNTNYSILLTPDDNTINDMVSLQIVIKRTNYFEIKGLYKDPRDGQDGGGYYDFNTRYFQWAIIR